MPMPRKINAYPHQIFTIWMKVVESDEPTIMDFPTKQDATQCRQMFTMVRRLLTESTEAEQRTLGQRAEAYEVTRPKEFPNRIVIRKRATEYIGTLDETLARLTQ